MALDTTTPRPRRAILAAALGGLGGLIASALGRPARVEAADGEYVQVGGEYTSSSVTKITNSGAGGTALQGNATYGVKGQSSAPTGAGVWGTGGGWGVYGSNGTGVGVEGINETTTYPAVRGVSKADGTGVLGWSGPAATPPPPPTKTGVYGEAAQDAASRGVWGKSTSGQGVRGEATSGIGVQAVGTTGRALVVTGRVTFSRSGRASIAANQSYVDVTVPGGLSSNATVLATLQILRSGAYVAAARPNWPSAGKARIYLNKVASTSATTPVAWFVLG